MNPPPSAADFVGPVLPDLELVKPPISGSLVRAYLRAWNAEHAPLAELIGSDVDSLDKLVCCVLRKQSTINRIADWVRLNGQDPRQWAAAGQLSREPIQTLEAVALSSAAMMYSNASPRLDPQRVKAWLPRLHGVIPPNADIIGLRPDQDPERMRGKAPGKPTDAKGTHWYPAKWRPERDPDWCPLAPVGIEYLIHAGGNIGLALGSAKLRGDEADAVNLAAVDLDTTEPHTSALMKLACEVIGELGGGAQPAHRPGRVGRGMMLFRTDEPMGKFTLHAGDGQKVEFLGHGQQIVIDGTHPTGTPYRTMPPLHEFGPDDLPMLTLAQVQELADKLKELGQILGLDLEFTGHVRPGAAPGNDARPVPQRAELVGEIEEVRELMPLIAERPDRDGWVEVAHAARGATLDSPAEGFEVFLEWSHHESEAEISETQRVWDTIDLPHLRSGIRDLRRMAGRPAQRTDQVFDVLPDETEPQSAAEPQSTADLARDWVAIGDEPEEPAEQAWLIQGLVPQQGLVVIYGAPAAGKTTLAISMIVHLCAGLPWFGHEVANGVGVVVVAAESPRGVRRRARAAAKAYGVDLNLPLIVSTRPLDMRRDTKATAAKIDWAIKEVKRRFGVTQVAIIFDTLTRAWAGINDNNPEDMSEVVGHCDGLRAQGYTAIVLHHPGKDKTKGMRGHSSLLAAADTAIFVEHDKGARGFLLEKQRDGEDGERHSFHLRTETLDLTPSGIAITAPVVIPEDSPPPARPGGARRRPLTDNQQAVLRALHEAVDKHGIEFNDGSPPTSRPKVVDINCWRATYLGSKGELDRDGRKAEGQRFLRGVEALQGTSHVNEKDGHFWLPPACS